MKKPLIIISIIVVALGAATYFYLSGKNKNNRPQWLTEQPLKKDIQILVTATGTVNPVKSVEVGTQVSGVISKIWVDFNDVVKKDQPIAQIDRTNLLTTLDEVKANLEKVQAQYIQTKSEYERSVFLLDKKVIPKADYELALSNYHSGKNSVAAAQAEVKKALTNLQYATIKAPINGVIVSREVDVGQTVAASFATPKLFVIANDLTKMQVQANVDEADIGQVRTGQNVLFTVDAYPGETFKGIVQQIRLQPNTIQNVVNYSVVIDAPNPDLKLLPGMNADISIIVQEKKNVLAIPLAATKFRPPNGNKQDTAGQNDKSHPVIYVLENGQLKPIHINTGISDGVYVEVPEKALTPQSTLVVGVKTKETDQKTKSLFQGPRPNTGSSIRNMR